jgi:hypothetical protein
MMNRRNFVLLLADKPEAKPACPVQISVGPGKSVEVVYPQVRKQDVASIIAMILGKEKPADLERLLNQADEITFVITSRCRKT